MRLPMPEPGATSQVLLFSVSREGVGSGFFVRDYTLRRSAGRSFTYSFEQLLRRLIGGPLVLFLSSEDFSWLAILE